MRAFLVAALAASPAAAQDIAQAYLEAERRLFASRAQFEAERAAARSAPAVGSPAAPVDCRAFREDGFDGEGAAIVGVSPADEALEGLVSELIAANRLDLPARCPAFFVPKDDVQARSWIELDPARPLTGEALAERRRAAPRGLYVLSGTIDILPDDGMLAALLAHELAHLALQHSADAQALKWRMQRDGKVYSWSFYVWDRNPLVGGDYAAWWRQEMVKDDEEADRTGAAYLARAGYSPWDMARLLDFLAARSNRKDDYWARRREALRASLGEGEKDAPKPGSARMNALRVLFGP